MRILTALVIGFAVTALGDIFDLGVFWEVVIVAAISLAWGGAAGLLEFRRTRR